MNGRRALTWNLICDFGLEYLEATKRVLSGRTDSVVLHDLAATELEKIPADGRENLQKYLSELVEEVGQLKKTINFLQNDIGFVRYLKKTREVANFMKIDQSFLTTKRSESETNANVEAFNGQQVRVELVIKAKASAQVLGWCFTVGLIPEAETTQRFLTLKCVDTGDVYIAIFSDTHARADVAKGYPSIDPKFLLRSGFTAPLGFYDVPAGKYRVGVGQFGPGRYGQVWMRNVIQVL